MSFIRYILSKQQSSFGTMDSLLTGSLQSVGLGNVLNSNNINKVITVQGEYFEGDSSFQLVNILSLT